MSYKIYIPIDSTAKSLGANEVAHLIELELNRERLIFKSSEMDQEDYSG